MDLIIYRLNMAWLSKNPVLHTHAPTPLHDHKWHKRCLLLKCRTAALSWYFFYIIYITQFQHVTCNWIWAGHEVERDGVGGARRVGGARASVGVQLVKAVSGGSHVALHLVQEAFTRSSCPHHTGRGGGRHHQPSPFLPAAAVTVAGVLGAFIPACCWLGRIAGQRGCKSE